MDGSRLIGIYLAAGNSSRMGRDKLNLPFGDMRLGSMAFKEAIESKLHSVIAVTRKGNSLQWLAPFSNIGKWKSIVVEETSQSESLIAGLKAAEDLGADGVLVFLADQPFVSREMINQLLEGFQANTFRAFTNKGRAMPPVLFSKGLFKSLMNLKGDQGARDLIRGERELGRLVELKDDHPFWDIDTQEDYIKISRLIHRD